ncbi:hypothetical protein ACH47X_04255 [Promicromonospora kroppenstedtii]|uniref:Uncharacterized protein n=1 Tax=Promicromonospora kroppenstedtii TaxID=440482 RepID=A0ABW7XFT0_9MICO
MAAQLTVTDLPETLTEGVAPWRTTAAPEAPLLPGAAVVVQ